VVEGHAVQLLLLVGIQHREGPGSSGGRPEASANREKMVMAHCNGHIKPWMPITRI